MGKVSLLHERLATSTSAFKGNSGEHAFLPPSFLLLRPRRPDVKTELVTVPASTLSAKASVSSQSRTAVASLLPRTMEGSLPTEVKSVCPLRADLTARRQCRKSSFYRTLI